MDILAVIWQLHLELERIDRAILSLEGLEALRPRRRGRPPKPVNGFRSERGADAERKTGANRRCDRPNGVSRAFRASDRHGPEAAINPHDAARDKG